MSADQIRELWSKTYDREGRPDWSHLFPYYRDDIRFKDSIQELRGIEAFKELCRRLAERCSHLEMVIPSIVKEDRVVFMQWEMTMSFKKNPTSTIYGATRLLLHEDDGRIAEQRDYYDLWGDIFDNIPWFAKPYRRFMAKKFG